MDIRDFFTQNNKVALAFSGGVDSSYLLKAATDAGADVCAYYVRSQFQPEFEFLDACEVAELCGAEMKVLKVDVLSDDIVVSNPENRCYYCKQRIMGTIIKAAAQDGYDVIIDGTNASDDAGDRPGTKVLREFGVKSPLRECGITKAEVRRLSRVAGLPVWDKPAYACLATRIPHGEVITADKLERTEAAEAAMAAMGFKDFRVRMRGDAALVQVTAEQHDEAVRRQDEIISAIGHLYSAVVIDEKTR